MRYIAFLSTLIICICVTLNAQTPDLNKYNVVWTTQSQNSSESMPCRGDDIGLNVWVEKGEILLYLSRSGDGLITSPQLNMTHRNNQRIGVAVADDPNGPWKQFDQPIIDISPDTTAHDAQMMANPSVTQMPDGRYLMVYKAVARKRPQPFGGPVIHLTAIADKSEGPFVKQNKPIFTAENVDFPAEDPFVWYQDNCYYAIVQDMKGAFTYAGRSLVLFYSLDGLDWKLAKQPLVSTLNINWENGTTQKLEALERPQLFFENGKIVALLCAVNETLGHSYNVQIPLNVR